MDANLCTKYRHENGEGLSQETISLLSVQYKGKGDRSEVREGRGGEEMGEEE